VSEIRGARAVPALLALLALLALRLPTNGVQILNVDEADFAVEAGVLLDGGRPYVDFVEKKPPLVYYLYAGALRVVGRYNLPAFRLLLIGYVLASALVLSAIARRLYGDKVALLVAPLYAVTVSVGLPMDVHAANSETLFLLPLLACRARILWILQIPARAISAPPGLARRALPPLRSGWLSGLVVEARVGSPA
jgi:4-amino-4-deoxy-L-arabinose transferase-like glycosyltransferase